MQLPSKFRIDSERNPRPISSHCHSPALSARQPRIKAPGHFTHLTPILAPPLRLTVATRAGCKTSKTAWSSRRAPTAACRTTSSSSSHPMPTCLGIVPTLPSSPALPSAPDLLRPKAASLGPGARIDAVGTEEGPGRNWKACCLPLSSIDEMCSGSCLSYWLQKSPRGTGG